MKKFMIPLAFLGLSTLGLAQESEKVDTSNDYNKWSIELNGGVNKPIGPFTHEYFTSTFNLYHVDLGVRYMFNPKFGLKLDGGLDNIKNADSSKEFESNYYRVSLQAVANLGRIMNFETWTNTFGLLAHAGGGYSALFNDNFKDADGIFEKGDEFGHLIFGLTGQVKLFDKLALTGDVSMIASIDQKRSFDGNSFYKLRRGIDGDLFTSSLGLTYYIGGNEKHADWTTIGADGLAARIDELEAMLLDSDNDGVADYLDLEPNSSEGAVVDTKGVTIDSNGNGVPDDIETYINGLNLGDGSVGTLDSKVLEQIINSGIINVYFDYDSATPFNASVGGVDFVIDYMKSNPSANIDIIGYADPKGGNSYNLSLSQKRADAVKRLITNAGINSSRLSAVGKGIDAEFRNSAISAHQLARRVIFKIK